jgi:aspartate aminotransferase-like enzyme
MGTGQPLIYKIATDRREFELIHQLNYRTFVEEIPQHASNPEGRLADRFHDENTYVISLSGRELVGMIALRDRRPFSLDLKLDDLDAYLPQRYKNPLEIRLLAVDPRYRNTTVLLDLMLRCVDLAKSRAYDIGLISGTTRQLKLYEHLGFRPFGPLVGTSDAMFQPMYLTWEALEKRVGDLLRRSRAQQTGNFLPGPVALSKSVREAVTRDPISHRSVEFEALYGRVKMRLKSLTGAEDVAVLQGSGTLANDVIGAQLSLLGGHGLVLANGEFGGRLVNHAERFELGKAFNFAKLDRLIAADPVSWLWAVHCETSTGGLNDIAALKCLSKRHGFKLCMDCVSSIGAVEVDLTGVHLASGASGKALGALPGLCFVFIGGLIPTQHRLPRYLDISLYLAGVPFTMSSNLLAALESALDQAGNERYQRIAGAARRFREQMAEGGLEIVGDTSVASPHVMTIALPKNIDSSALARELTDRGLLVAYASDYLHQRNWIQVCLMSEFTTSSLDRLTWELTNRIQDSRAAEGQPAA